MKIKTSELTGAALDWAVAIAEGWTITSVPKDIDGNYAGEVLVPHGYSEEFKFTPRGEVPINYFVSRRKWSSDWSQGGPLIEKYTIGLNLHWGEWGAWIRGTCYESNDPDAYAATPLIAACRAIVAAKLGDEVDIPEDLL